MPKPTRRLLPPLTALQYLILSRIPLAGEISGPDLRDDIGHYADKLSGTSFYQAISRLEGCGWIGKRTIPVKVVTKFATECRYSITPAGVQSCLETMKFYMPKSS